MKSANVPCGWLRSAIRAPRVLLAVQIVLLLLLPGAVVTQLWQDRVWLGYLLLGTAALAWAPEMCRRRDRLWWFVYVAGIFLYTLLRSHADDTAIPTRTSYVIDADAFLLFGTQPVEWLQHRLFDPQQLSLLDWAAVGVHWSFFIAPHAAAIAVFSFRRSLFPRFATFMVTTWYAGLVIFFVLPTTPPWLAAEQGHLDGVFRVMDFVGSEISADAYDALDESVGEPNNVAAMPSLHLGITFALLLWAWAHHPRHVPWLGLYTLAMGFALLYLAEHYLLDMVAGAALATAVFAATERWLGGSRAPAEARSGAREVVASQ